MTDERVREMNEFFAHKGRSTQVWDCEVTNESTGRTIALFRSTQMILYPPT